MGGEGQPKTAVLVIDMLSTYDHEDSDRLAANAERTVPVIASLLERARASDVGVIYVNDNYGDWNSSAEELASDAMDGRRPDLVEPLLPVEGDSFILKLRHSVFYATPLQHLLSEHGGERLVLSGQVTEQCILYSAIDAYFRDYDVVIPADAVAHIDEGLAEAALNMIAGNMGGEIVEAAECLR